MATRGKWGSRMGFILAAAGSAVGLGNIWKFPYITGVYGGGAFVLVYLGFILVVGLPIMISELIIGHRAQKNPVGAIQELDGKKSFWQSAGWLGIASGFVILSFYSIVAGQAMAYIFKSISGFFGSATEIQSQYTSLKTNAGLSIIWHTIFMGITMGIVIGGIKNGIEKWSKILMPTLVLILIGLTFYGLFFSEGGIKALNFLFKPDFSKLSSEAVLSALGHAFFTLSLGMGAMITYGSYLDKKINLPRAAITVVIMDTVIALLAGIAIFSLVFEYGMKVAAGPGLIFETLPVLFRETGQLISVPFFLLLTFAALTSGISLLEVVVSYFIDEKKWSRVKAVLIIGGSIYVMGLLPALDKIKVLFKGKEQSFFDIFDFVSTNYMLPAGGLLISLFVGWKMKEKIIESEVFNSTKPYYVAWRYILKFLTPIAVMIIILHGLEII
ncbi:MAG: sodium-dependent transporter [Acidobacteriota bacterium]